jgi:glutamate transport system permease protein
MSAPILADELGPRGRRIVWIATAVSAVVLAFLVYVALKRFGDNGQLDGDKWRKLFEPDVLRFLWGGLANTLKAAGGGMAGALALGLVLSMTRLVNNRLVRVLSRLFTEFFRGFPLLLLILFSFFGLPKLGIDWAPIWYLILALAVYNGTVLGEIVRSGVLSLDKGQGEAAAAIGLGYWPSMRLVILPQAFRRMVPALVGQLVVLLKDTSLGFFVLFEELLKRAEIAGRAFKNDLQAFILVAVVYMIVNMTLSQVARRLEVRQRRRYGAGALAVAGVEDLAAVDAAAEAKVN